MEDISIKPEPSAPAKLRKKRLSSILGIAAKNLELLHKPDVNDIEDDTGLLGREKVRVWVLVGTTLNQYSDEAQRSLRQIHLELTTVVPKLSLSAMHRCMSIAAHFHNSMEKFEQWYAQEHVHDTLTGVYNTIFQTKKVTLDDTIQTENLNPFVKACNAIDEMQRYSMLSEKNYLEYGGKLMALRDMIESRMPVATDFAEDSFFRHSPCCICKKSSTTETGWELYSVTVEQIELLVPVCPGCLHRTEQINWIQVAYMYFLYSMVAQNEIYKYTNTPISQSLRPGVYNVEL